MLGKAIDFYIPGRFDRRIARRRPARPARRRRLLSRPRRSCTWTPAACGTGRGCRSAARQDPGEGTTCQPQCFRRPLDPARERGAGERHPQQRAEFDAVVPEQAVRRRRRSRERRRSDRDRNCAARQTAPAAPKIARAAMAARAPDKPAVVAAAPEPRREKVAAIPMPQAKPVKAETYQVASAGSVPVKLAGYEVASATSTPVRADSVKVAQAPLPVRAETDTPAKAVAPVRPAQAASSSAARTCRPTTSSTIAAIGRDCRAPTPRMPARPPSRVPRRPRAARDREGRDRERRALADRRPRQRSRAGASERWDMRRRRLRRLRGHCRPRPATAASPPVNSDAGGSRRTSSRSSRRAERKGPDVVQVGDRFNDPVGARDDGEPERATVHEDDALRLAGFPQPRTAARQACVGRVGEVRRRSDERDEHRELRRQRGGLHADRQLPPAHRLAALNSA